MKTKKQSIVNRIIMSWVLLLFGATLYAQSCAENGGVFTPKGDIKALVVFVGLNEYSNSSQYPLLRWNGNLPDYVDPITGEFDEFIYNSNSDFLNYSTAAPEGKSLSMLFNEMSKPKEDFKFTAGVFTDQGNHPIRVDIDINLPTAASNWGTLNSRVLAKMKLLNPAFKWASYDQRTNNPNFLQDGSNSAADGKPDYVIFIYRYNNNWNPINGIRTWSGSGGGYATLDGLGNQIYNGYEMSSEGFTMCFSQGLPKQLFFHEVAHKLWLAPHTCNSNGVSGFYFHNYLGKSATSNSIGAAWNYSMIGLERWNMDYIDLVGDVEPNSTDPNGYVLRDYISQGDALRIEIPFSGGQHLWIENHKNTHAFDHHQWAGATSISPYTLPDKASGAYLYIDFILEDKCDQMGGISPMPNRNGIKYLNASGNHDYSRSTNYTLNGWNNKVYDFTRLEANPISGINPWMSVRGDYDLINGILNGITVNTHGNGASNNEGSEIYILREDLGAGVFHDTYRGFGIWDLTYNAYARKPTFEAGDKLNMSSNPMIVSHNYYSKGFEKFDRQYLNGLEVRFENGQYRGDLKVFVEYEKAGVDNDVRWSHNDLALPNITGDAGYDLILASNKQITINRSETVNRHTVSPSNDYINNSQFTIENGASIHLLANSTLSIEDHSTLVIDPNTTVVLEENASIIIDATSTLLLKGNNIKLNGPNAKIVIRGSLETAPGVDFNFQGSGFVQIYPGHQLDLGANSKFRLVGLAKGHRFMELVGNAELNIQNRDLVLNKGKVIYGPFAKIVATGGWVSVNENVLAGTSNNVGLKVGNNAVFHVTKNDFEELKSGLQLEPTGQDNFVFERNNFNKNEVGVQGAQLQKLNSKFNNFQQCGIAFQLVNCTGVHSKQDVIAIPSKGMELNNSVVVIDGSYLSGYYSLSGQFLGKGIEAIDSDITLRGGAVISGFLRGIHSVNVSTPTPQHFITVGDLSCARITNNSIGIEGNDVLLKVDAQQHAIDRGSAQDVTPNSFSNYSMTFDVCYHNASVVTSIVARKNDWGNPPTVNLRKKTVSGSCDGFVATIPFTWTQEASTNCFPGDDGGVGDPGSGLIMKKNVDGIHIEFEAGDPIGWSVFPNPTQGAFTVEFNLGTGTTGVLTIATAVGKVVLTQNIAGGGQINFNGLSLPSGTYFISIASGGQTTTKQLVVQ